MKFILKYIRKNIIAYGMAVFCMLGAVGLDLLNPLITRSIIDDVIKNQKLELLFQLMVALLIVTFGRALLGYMREYLFDYASIRVAAEMRKDLFHHLNTLSLSFFDRQNTGELMARIKEDVDSIWDATGFAFMLLIEHCIYIILPTVILFRLSWQLTLIYLAFLPVILYLAARLEQRLGAVYDKISDQAAVLNTTAQENIAGVRLVKSFAREHFEERKFAQENKRNYELNYEQTRVWAGLHPLIEFLSNIMTIIVITVGGIMVIGDELTIGTLVAINSYGIMLSWPMKELGWLMNVMARAAASVRKVTRLLDEKPEIEDPEQPEQPEVIRGRITFEHVRFEVGGNRILDDISFDVPPGATLAIMGSTGAGKSSIINLLSRFYDCTEGSVRIDGTDVRKWKVKKLRQQIALVMQDVFLFSDSVRENLCFGHDTDLMEEKDYPWERIRQACEDAQAEAFISELPEQYESVIGERGLGLSGGQKQRISIARAFLKEAKILVLDDATSALDMETEYAIQKAISRRQDITKVIIAHRISAVKEADEIIILDEGRIIERGTHEELMKKRGYYYDTYQLQYGTELIKEA